MNSLQTRSLSCSSVSIRSLTHDRWAHGSTTYLEKGRKGAPILSLSFGSLCMLRHAIEHSRNNPLQSGIYGLPSLYRHHLERKVGWIFIFHHQQLFLSLPMAAFSEPATKQQTNCCFDFFPLHSSLMILSLQLPHNYCSEFSVFVQ